MYIYITLHVKGKIIPVQAVEALRVALGAGRFLPPERFLVLISVRD
jgi:hypothetical protein